MKVGAARVNHQEKAAQMRSVPGVWVEVNTYSVTSTARGFAHRIEQGVYEGRWYSPAGAFETKTELAEFGTKVFGRYKGESDGEEGRSV